MSTGSAVTFRVLQSSRMMKPSVGCGAGARAVLTVHVASFANLRRLVQRVAALNSNIDESSVEARPSAGSRQRQTRRKPATQSYEATALRVAPRQSSRRTNSAWRLGTCVDSRAQLLRSFWRAVSLVVRVAALVIPKSPWPDWRKKRSIRCG